MRGRRRGPVFEVEPAQLLGSLAGAVQQGLEIGEGVAIGNREESVQDHARPRCQSAAQFPALSVVAAKPHRTNHAHAQGGEIVENGSGSARLAAGGHDIVHRQIRLQRDFLPRRIDVEIAVQAEVARHGELERRVPGRQSVKAFTVHADTSSRWRCWMKLRLSHCRYRMAPPILEKLLQKRR